MDAPPPQSPLPQSAASQPADSAAAAFDLGATRLADGQTQFIVWAPFAAKVKLHLLSPVDRLRPMERMAGHYFRAAVADTPNGALYRYRLYGSTDGGPDRGAHEFPDPVSRSQPAGVHGPSAVVDQQFDWTDGGWRGFSLADYVAYELHIGAFTQAGSFDGVLGRLDALVELGITAIEIMPVAQCPGERNWGYDGVYPFAAQHAYGGALGLKRLVDGCHRRGLAVVLDVVYNHLGPEGNYLARFGPYFTDRYRTPWGAALNFDGRHSDEVRRFFIANALQWIDEFHIDALRLDAVHAIFDNTARPFLQELADAVHQRARELGRQVFLIAETNRNTPATVRPAAEGGLGLDAQWVDDFGRAVHALLTGERHGFYSDFGAVSDVAKALREGYVITGQYSRYRGRRHGAASALAPADRFLAFVQNHDEVGNRPGAERLGRLCNFDQLKLAAATMLLSPNVPLLFMGEEYDELAPFHYFVDHGDPQLIENVRAGRRREIPLGLAEKFADPGAMETFAASRLDFDLRAAGRHAILWRFYQRLIRLRRDHAAIRQTDRSAASVDSPLDRPMVVMHRTAAAEAICVLLNFAPQPTPAPPGCIPPGVWRLALDSAAPEWRWPEAKGGDAQGADAQGGDAQGGELGGSDATALAELTIRSPGETPAVTLSPWSCVLYVRRV